MMEPGAESAAWIVFTSQVAWITRFLIALGVFGCVVWYLKKIMGLDLEEDISNLEALLASAAEDKNVALAIPFTTLALAIIFVVGFTVGGFLD